jgi:hypothetical protein
MDLQATVGGRRGLVATHQNKLSTSIVHSVAFIAVREATVFIISIGFSASKQLSLSLSVRVI